MSASQVCEAEVVVLVLVDVQAFLAVQLGYTIYFVSCANVQA